MLDAQKIKSQFPIFSNPLNKGLVYLDNAATTQKPQRVIDKLVQYYTQDNANIHRGLYSLAQRADDLFESTRSEILSFFNANDTHEVLFCKGTTDGINVVANSFVAPRIEAGDNIVVTELEHHANFIPWQQLCTASGAEFRIVPILENGQPDVDKLKELIDHKTKFISITQLSNTLGVIVDISSVKNIANEKGVPILIDAAQSVASFPINVGELNPDFLVFSGHKLFGPTGVGVVLVAKRNVDKMMPYQFGGDMVKRVGHFETSFADFPALLEPGTPNIAGVIGLSEAIKFIKQIGIDRVQRHQKKIREQAWDRLSELDDITLYGSRDNSTSIISFNMEGVHPHDVATILSENQIAVRAGHHCTQPLLRALGVQGTVRVSFSIYNDANDLDKLILSLSKIRKIFS